MHECVLLRSLVAVAIVGAATTIAEMNSVGGADRFSGRRLDRVVEPPTPKAPRMIRTGRYIATPVRRRAWTERDYYRLRADAWQMQAMRLGIRPSVRALADASGVPKSTLYRVAKGQPPGPETTAALLRTLKLPFESLFEQVPAS
jgi:hypothetical protein